MSGKIEAFTGWTPYWPTFSRQLKIEKFIRQITKSELVDLLRRYNRTLKILVHRIC